MVAIKFLVLVSCVCVLGWVEWEPRDLTGWTERRRIRGMANELVMEAKLRIRQVDGLKDEINTFKAFGIGTIFGRIREKYRSMLELYRMTRNKFTGASSLKIPSIERWRPMHFVIRLEAVRAAEVEIDQMIFIIERMEESLPASNLELLSQDKKKPLAMGKPA